MSQQFYDYYNFIKKGFDILKSNKTKTIFFWTNPKTKQKHNNKFPGQIQTHKKQKAKFPG